MKILLKELREKKLIYVRSPRGSAKSSIRFLLEKQAIDEENGFSKVISILGTNWQKDWNSKTDYYKFFKEK
jgi:hypothetical protein